MAVSGGSPSIFWTRATLFSSWSITSGEATSFRSSRSFSSSLTATHRESYLPANRPDFSTSGAVKTGEVEMGPVAVALKATKAAAVWRNLRVR